MAVPPLLITGMHRSGTSATARLLQQAGLDLGARLMAPRLDNPLGYYEDLQFADLNRALIAAGVGDDPRCEPDWAFPDRIVPSRLAPLRPRAAALVAARGALGRPWGFKDPRASVLLDFYDELAPDARYVFVYRAPWEVVESLMRTQERPLQGRAGLAVETWKAYNARLLEFRERNPGRTALVHIDAVAQRPDEVVGLAQDLLQELAPATLDAGATHHAFTRELMRRSDALSPLAELLSADHPEAVEMYARLEAAADVAGLQPSRNGGPPEIKVEVAGGALPLAAVVVGGGSDGVHDATLVARPAAGADAGEAADAGVDRLPGELVAVVFEGRLRPDALARAVAALKDDPGLGAVLLAAGDTPAAPCEHDPLAAADAGAAIVVRRNAWLATRGFAAAHPPEGFEAWSFAVECLAQGVRTVRVAGALEAPQVTRDGEGARRRVLERHPSLATQRALDAEAELDRATEQIEHLEQLHATAARRALDADEAEAERDRVAEQLEQLRAKRGWRLGRGGG